MSLGYKMSPAAAQNSSMAASIIAASPLSMSGQDRPYMAERCLPQQRRTPRHRARTLQVQRAITLLPLLVMLAAVVPIVACARRGGHHFRRQ